MTNRKKERKEIETMIEEIEETVPDNALYYFRLGEDILEGLIFTQQLQKVSSFIRSQCNSENLNFLIGSGCSLPSIPLMGQTFKFIKENHLKPEILGEYIGENNDIESYLNWLKNAITFLGASVDGTIYKEAFEVTKKELLKSITVNYDSEKNSDFNTTLKNYVDFYNTLFSTREFKKLSPINIFTTNYDLFNEIAMEKLKIHYTTGFRGVVNSTFDPSLFRLRLVDDENRYKDKWSVVRRYIKLYKIHGSVNWKYDSIVKSIVQKQTNIEEDNLNDILIYPTINKHLETQQSPYSELIRDFTINLQKKNSTLIIVGYGFPDDHLNQLISQALNNEDFNLVIFGNNTEGNSAKFLELHKDKHNLHFIGGNFGGKQNGHHFVNVLKYMGHGDNDEKPE